MNCPFKQCPWSCLWMALLNFPAELWRVANSRTVACRKQQKCGVSQTAELDDIHKRNVMMNLNILFILHQNNLQKRMNSSILFFQSSRCKIDSAARNWIISFPQLTLVVGHHFCLTTVPLRRALANFTLLLACTYRMSVLCNDPGSSSAWHVRSVECPCDGPPEFVSKKRGEGELLRNKKSTR